MKRTLALSGLVCTLMACQPSTRTLTQAQDHCAAEEGGLGDLDRDSDGLLRADDLEAGEAAMVAVWTDAEGVERTGHYRDTETVIIQGNGLGELDKFGVWFRVDCEPEQAAFVWFEADTSAPLALGQHPLWALSWDVPPVEQGGNITGSPTGYVEVVDTDAESTWASGHLAETEQSFELISYLTQEGVGDSVHIRAMAFNQVPVRWH